MSHSQNKRRDAAPPRELHDKSPVPPAGLRDPKNASELKTSPSRRVIFMVLYVLLPVAVILTYLIVPLKSYAAGAVAVMAIPVILGVDPRFSRWRADNSVMFNFLLTVAATSVGVFLALFMNTKEAERIEVERATRFLDVGKTDLNSLARKTGVFMMGMKGDSDTDFSGADLAKRNPRPVPETFFAILGNDAVLRRVSPQSLAALTNCKMNMTSEIRIINNERLPNKTLRPIVDAYGKELYHAEQIITAEIEFMGGRIDENTLNGMLQMFIYQQLGKNPKDFDDAIKHPSTEPFDWKNLGKEKIP